MRVIVHGLCLELSRNCFILHFRNSGYILQGQSEKRKSYMVRNNDVLQVRGSRISSAQITKLDYFGLMLGQRSFSYAALTVWNTLPYKIRSSNTISSFISSLIAYLFQQSCWLCVLGGRGEGERVWTSGLSQSLRAFFLDYFVSCNGPFAPKEKWYRKEHIIMN